MDDLAGVDQSSHDFAANAEPKVALHARVDNAGEFPIGSLNRSGRGDPHERRIGARVGAGSATTNQQSGNGKRRC